MTELEIRSVEVRSFDTETRTIKGLAVPYGQTTDIGGYKERFEPGAMDADDVKLFYSHSEPIGKVIAGRDTDEGYEIEAVISKTTRGDEVYTLMRDEVLTKFSVGFLPLEHRMEEDVVVRTKVALKEVSVVSFPAYAGAQVSEVRTSDEQNEKEDINMSNEEIESRVADLEGRNEDLERRFVMLSDAKSDEGAPQFRTAGEYIKALADGSSEAREFATRDFGTTVEADVVRPGWVSEGLRLVAENRPVINAFSKGRLPDSGNSIEYPYVKTTTGTVSSQAAEGDALPYMEVALDTATAAVKTYGGYTSLSRQAIERSDLAYLETSLEYMVRQYAKATEKAVRDAIVAASGTGTATLATDDAEGWIDVVVDAVDYIDENDFGARANVGLASPDVWKRLAHMVDDTGRPLFAISGQSVNSLGDANLVVPSLNVAGLTVVKNVNFADDTFIVAASDAVKTFESAGAPYRLQDENIINLTKDFSLYGYLAVAILNAKGIVKVDVDLA